MRRLAANHRPRPPVIINAAEEGSGTELSLKGLSVELAPTTPVPPLKKMSAVKYAGRAPLISTS